MTDRDYAEWYLGGLARAKYGLERRQEQLDELYREVIGVKAIRYDKELIDQTPVNTTEEKMAKYLDAARKMEGYIESYIQTKDRLLEQIDEMSNMCEKNGTKYSQMLYKVYAEEKNMSIVSREMSYSEQHAYRIKGEALDKFYELFMSNMKDESFM